MKKKLWFVLLWGLVCLFSLSACEKGNTPDDDNNSDFNEEDGVEDQTPTAGIAFDVTQFNGASSKKLVSILGAPDEITETYERGFASFPCKLYDYENHELGFLRFDIINDKVTAISINGELPYNNGKVLESLNVKATNDDYISESDAYKKWECPTNDIDLIHITLIDTNKDTYKSLTVEFDSQYYREWNLPVFYGGVSPGEYNALTKDFIKSLLTYPDSANFPAFDWDYARNDYYFRVESYVDAQNAFGGTIRYNFSLIYYNDTRILACAILDGEVAFDNEYVSTRDIIESMFEDTEGGTPQPSPPPTEPEPPCVECEIYTETELPVSVKYGSKEIWVNGIDYIFCDINQTVCTFCISFDLISDYTVEGFDLKFSLTGRNTGTVMEYSLEDINVYGKDGNYISLDGDFIGWLPIDNYTIVFKDVAETEDDTNLSVDDLSLHVQNVELENSTGRALFSEVGGLFLEAENGMCNLSITFFGDKYQDNYFYLEYSLVGEHTGTVLQFSDYIYEYSDYHDGYYNFVFTINHNDIPIDYYTIVFEDMIAEDSSENLSIEDLYLTVQEFEFDNFEDTDYVIIGEIEWEFYSLSNGKCGLEITIYGDYLVYLEYSLVGKYTGTVIDFSDDLHDHSNQNTNYNYDYSFVSKIEHENIPMDCYTLIIETAIVY